MGVNLASTSSKTERVLDGVRAMQWGAGHFKRTSSQRASFQGEAVSAERSCSVPSDTKAEGTNCSGGHIRVWLEEGLPPTLRETQPDNPNGESQRCPSSTTQESKLATPANPREHLQQATA